MFEEQTFEEISSRMLSNVDDKYDKREGSVIYDATAPTALELALIYSMIDMVLDEVFADTASYYYLIKRASERGLQPKEETKAILKMEVMPITAAITAGDRFNLNELNYTVVQAIEGETGSYQVECETAGTVGNQQLGAVLQIETTNELNDLESAELTEVLIPGEDEEDVETFRERYFGSFGSEAFGGNMTDYKQKVNDIDGVGGCKVIREWKNGYNPATFIPNDTITTWYSAIIGTLSGEGRKWLTAVYTAAKKKLLTVGGTVKVIIINSEYKKPSDVLVGVVQTILDPEQNAGEGLGIAPIGHVVNVVGVTEKTVNFSATITYSRDYSFAILKDTICEAIDNYFSELSQQWDSEDYLIVRTSEFDTRLMAITGISDISNIRLNGSASNLILSANEIPVRGSVNG